MPLELSRWKRFGPSRAGPFGPAIAVAAALTVVSLARSAGTPPQFELVQPELFGATGGQPNAWADFDNDGDLDLFIAFRDKPNRLFRNDGGASRT